MDFPTNLETFAVNEQTNYRLNEINKIKNYFECEIKEQEVTIKKLTKHITDFDYTDNILTIFSSLFPLFFCLSTEIIKKLLYETKKDRKNTTKYFI